MLIVLIAEKRIWYSGFGLTILEYSRTVYYSELPIPSYKETSGRDGSYRDKNVEVCHGTRKDKIRNEYIRGTVKVEWLGMKMREGRLRWYGHVMRRNKEYVG